MNNQPTYLTLIQSLLNSPEDEQITILQTNLELIDDNFAQYLREWATQTLAEMESEESYNFADNLYSFNITISSFPLGSRAANIEIAIACLEVGLIIFTREAYPKDWGYNQNSLGVAYKNRIREDKAENLERAIACYDLALLVYTRADFPQQWATTQNNLANAYSDRIREDKAENIEKAIACYELALEIRTRADFPQQWATTQNNLANAYSDRIREDKAENLERAIACYDLALEVYTRAAFPQQWATTQNNLAIAYYSRIREDKAENIEKAIACYELALEVRTRAASPQDWAMTQNNLAAAYSDRIREDKAENIEKAIACYELALEVRTRAAFPQDWAMTQNNLAIAYSDRIREDKAENIEKAIACYDLALLVSTRAAFPQDWAETQENLAYVYQEKGLIPEAIKHFKSSLEIFKPDALPLSCLKVARNLGDLGFAESLWETAIFGYEKAIEAVEQSREWMASENRKREIIEENLDVYEKMMQSCINYQQYDKALQTIERSKSRYLVELFTNSEIYPKTATATEKQQLQNLRRQIASLQQFLETQTPISPLPTPVSPLPPPLTKGGPGGVPDSPSQRTTQTRPHIPELSQQQEKLVTALQQLEQFLETFKQREPEFKLTQKIQPIDIAEFQKTLDPKTAIIEWYIGNSPEGGHAPSTAPTDVGGPRYLLDGFPDGVKYSPSLQLLELVKNRITTRKSPPPNQQQLFALQNPTEDLFNADMEVETIKTRFDLHQILLKKQATKIALNANGENIANANYLHFSCHGVFDFDYPLLSSLVLADSLEPILEINPSKPPEINPPQPPLAKGGLREENPLANGGLEKDGLKTKRTITLRNTRKAIPEKCLTLGDIFGELQLPKCSLVTLSACETGLTSSTTMTDEYIGLPSGFLYAGSMNVVSSLWAVDDFATAILMIKFYQELPNADSVAIALNAAQNWMRAVSEEDFRVWVGLLNLDEKSRQSVELWLVCSSEEQPFRDPIYWAAFCATGY